MIKQVAKLVWNNKKRYVGMFIEQAMIVFVLIILFLKLFELVDKYKEPGLLDTRNVLTYGFMLKNTDARAEVIHDMSVVNDNLKKLSFVRYITHSRNLAPFIGNDNRQDSVFIDDIRMNVRIKGADEYGALVFQPEMEGGSWLTNGFLDDGTNPVVITRQFADKVKWENAVGKKFLYNSHTFTVVGVVAGLKDGLFSVPSESMVLPMYIMEKWPSSTNIEYSAKILKGEDKTFCNIFYKEFKKIIPPELAEPLIMDLQSAVQGNMFGHIFTIVILGVVVFFLTVFAFIGTMGLLWLHAQRLCSEFALRIAIGSTRIQLIYMVVTESLIVTCTALFPSLLLSVLIFESSSIRMAAIVTVVATMLLFSFVSALYPAWKISRINTAEILQYE